MSHDQQTFASDEERLKYLHRMAELAQADAAEARLIPGHPDAAGHLLMGLAPAVHTHPLELHNHDVDYAPAVHSHPAGTHNHDLSYSPLVHTHAYAEVAHTHLGYAPAVHIHDYAATGHSHPAGDATTLDGLDSTAFSRSDHTHPGGTAPQKVVTDQANSTVTLANATNMGFAVAVNTAYEFEYMLAITSAALTTGWQFGFTFPLLSVGGFFLATIEYQSSATAWTTQTLTASTTNLTNVAGALVTAAYVTAPAPIAVRIKGIYSNAAAPGTVQLQFRSEVATSAITLKRGSTLRVA